MPTFHKTRLLLYKRENISFLIINNTEKDETPKTGCGYLGDATYELNQALDQILAHLKHQKNAILFSVDNKNFKEISLNIRWWSSEEKNAYLFFDIDVDSEIESKHITNIFDGHLLITPEKAQLFNPNFTLTSIDDAKELITDAKSEGFHIVAMMSNHYYPNFPNEVIACELPRASKAELIELAKKLVKQEITVNPLATNQQPYGLFSYRTANQEKNLVYLEASTDESTWAKHFSMFLLKENGEKQKIEETSYKTYELHDRSEGKTHLKLQLTPNTEGFTGFKRKTYLEKPHHFFSFLNLFFNNKPTIHEKIYLEKTNGEKVMLETEPCNQASIARLLR